MRKLIIVLTVIIAVLAACTPYPPPTPGDPIFGFTVEDVDTDDLVEAAAGFDQRPTIRVVFQEGEPSSYYKPALEALQPWADIVGLLFDSTALADASLPEVKARTDAYLADVGDLVDIWEIGNEINGEWGDEGYPVRANANPAATSAKVDAIYEKVTAAGGQTALTGMFMPDCLEWPENEMFGWLDANISTMVKQGVDHAWLSYYEDNCTGTIYPQSYWQATFDDLAGLFPNSAVGFGEVGYSRSAWSGPGNTRNATYSTDAAKIAMMNRYYTLDITTPGYEGGYFWWYGYQDFVPHTGNPLWVGINDAFNAEAVILG